MNDQLMTGHNAAGDTRRVRVHRNWLLEYEG